VEVRTPMRVIVAENDISRYLTFFARIFNAAAAECARLTRNCARWLTAG
jgi:hypothetical protein